MSPSDMNDEQLRIAVAEALGWTKIEFRGPDGTYGRLTGVLPPIAVTQEVPYFPNDLNACHAFEKVLTHAQCNEYWAALLALCNPEGTPAAAAELHYAHATARQRCLALLAVLKQE